jgi:hypothetical protein
MSKGPPVDTSWISPIQLTHLDDDQLGELAQQIEMQTQRLNRAMRLVADAMHGRRRSG